MEGKVNKYLIATALLFQLLVINLKQFAHLTTQQEWDLWHMGIGMGVIIAVDALTALIKKISASNRPIE